MITVDLDHGLTPDEWPYDREEYPVTCFLDAAPYFAPEGAGDPTIVVHRFGGSYGPARFLLTAGPPAAAAIRLTLVNGAGVPIIVQTLSDIEIAEAPTPRVVGKPDADPVPVSTEERRKTGTPRGLELRATLRGHRAEIFRMAWSPDGQWLATPGVDGRIIVWDGDTGMARQQFDVSGNGINEIAWSPDGGRFAAACYDGHVRVWAIEPTARTATLLSSEHHGSDVRCAAWSPAGEVIAVGCESGEVRMSSTSGRDWTTRQRGSEHGPAVSAAWSPDGRILAVGFMSGAVAYIHAEDAVTDVDAESRRRDGGVTAVRWAPRGRSVVTGHWDGALVVRDGDRRAPSHPLTVGGRRGHDDTVSALTFSPDGRVLVSKAIDGRVRFWRTDTGDLFAELGEPASPFVLSGLAWNPRRPVLATLGDRDRVVRVWHVDLDALLPAPVVFPTATARPPGPAPRPVDPGTDGDYALVLARIDPGAGAVQQWMDWLTSADGGALSGSQIATVIDRGPRTPGDPVESIERAFEKAHEHVRRRLAAGMAPRRLYLYFCGQVQRQDGLQVAVATRGRDVIWASVPSFSPVTRGFEELVLVVDGYQDSDSEEVSAGFPPDASLPSSQRYFRAFLATSRAEVGALSRTLLEGLNGPAANPPTGDVTSTSLSTYLSTHPATERLTIQQSTAPIVFRRDVVDPRTTVVVRAVPAGTLSVQSGGSVVLQRGVPGDAVLQLRPGPYRLRHEELDLDVDLVVGPGPAVQSEDVAWPPARGRVRSRSTVAVSQARGSTGASWLAVEVLKGRASSAQLIRFGPPEAPRLLLYDGGGPGAYSRALRPRLEALRSEFFGSSPVRLDLVVVSHGDDDRIRGVLDLLKELRLAKENGQLPFAQVEEIWFNDLGSLVDQVERPGPSFSRRGPQLREDARFLGVRMNGGSDLLTSSSPRPRRVRIEGLQITVLGPSEEQIRTFGRRVPDLGTSKATSRGHRQSMAKAGDRSAPNLLSLVLLVESRGRTVLLCGDARGDDILAALRRDDRSRVDLMVVPHYGSSRTVTPEFFRQVVADHYVFCGDGSRWGWPDPEGIRMLLDARRRDAFTLYFSHAPAEFASTYPLRELVKRFETDQRRGASYRVRFANPDDVCLAIDLDAGRAP